MAKSPSCADGTTDLLISLYYYVPMCWKWIRWGYSPLRRRDHGGIAGFDPFSMFLCVESETNGIAAAEAQGSQRNRGVWSFFYVPMFLCVKHDPGEEEKTGLSRPEGPFDLVSLHLASDPGSRTGQASGSRCEQTFWGVGYQYRFHLWFSTMLRAPVLPISSNVSMPKRFKPVLILIWSHLINNNLAFSNSLSSEITWHSL